MNNVFIQKFLFELGISWNLKNVVIFPEKALLIQIHLTVNSITQCGNYKNFIKWYSELKTADDTDYYNIKNFDPKLYTIKDLKTIENIIKYGCDIPSYEPRKLNKSLD